MKRHLQSAVAATLVAVAGAAVEGAFAGGEAGAPLTLTRAGTNPSAQGAVPGNFSGSVRVDMLHAPTAAWRRSAADVGVEPGEMLSHRAFHAGWPHAFSPIPMARTVFESRPK